MLDDLFNEPLAALLVLAYGGIATILLLLIASRAHRRNNRRK